MESMNEQERYLTNPDRLMRCTIMLGENVIRELIDQEEDNDD